MKELSEKFINGAIKNGISKTKSIQIFDLIEKFAQYGFNKSHATAYSYISYQTAWLKTHYPAEFMSANLTSEMTNTNRVVVLINECRKLNIKVNAPNVNESGINFVPISNSEISYGLNAIKNVGIKALEQFIETREKLGNFSSFFDFVSKVDQRLVNKKVLESLILGGAFDSIHENRAQLFDAVDIAIKYGQQVHKTTSKNQINLFANDESFLREPDLPDLQEWDNQEKLSREKEVLGLYISGNPLLKYADILEELSNYEKKKKNYIKEETLIKIGGAISSFKLHYDKKNRAMAFFNLDCLGGQVEAIIFHEAFDKYKEIINDGNIVFLVGSSTTQNQFADLKIKVDEVVPINHAKQVLKTKEINIKIGKNISKEILNEVHALALQNSGESSFIVHMANEDGSSRRIVSKKVKVSVNNHFVTMLKDLIGESNVWVS